MPEFKINVKTTHEGDGARRAQEELKGVESSAKEVNKSLKEAQHAAKALVTRRRAQRKGCAGFSRKLAPRKGCSEGSPPKLDRSLQALRSV